MALARIGLGSNIGDSAAVLARAVEALERIGAVTARSSLYRSEPWGVVDQPPFLNAAVLLETALSPHELLAALKALETELGRVESYRWGPRALDLDILAYDDLVLDEPDLTVPHARLLERAFALAPLAEIEPAYAAALAELPEGDRAGVTRLQGRIGSLAERTARPVDWDETVARVRRAAAFCVDAGLERFRVEEDELTIEIRRRVQPEPLAAPAPALDEPAADVHHANGVAAPEREPEQVLKAEFVGIVRFARPPVAEGSDVEAGRELAHVEALGIRNPVRAAAAGRLAAVYVGDGQPVEYGQPLFALESAG